jgi:hypothetical protein
MLRYVTVEVPGSRTVDDETQDAQDNTPLSPDQETPEERRQSAVGSQPGSGSTLVPETSKTESEKLRDRESELATRGLPTPSEQGNYAVELKEHFKFSPLCPLHPSYTATGKGYCPFHSS